MSAEAIVLVVVLAVVVAVALLAAYLTAHRLDRLHIRTDLARSSLVGALGRRHAVAAAVVRDLAPRDHGASAALARALAHARAHPPHAVAVADPAPDPDRKRWEALGEEETGPDAELAENALGLELAGVDPAALSDGLAEELEDVTDRVGMARRFYNDAVRDTRALRERASVRALRLAGRAPMPDFVELVDPPSPGQMGVPAGEGLHWEAADRPVQNREPADTIDPPTKQENR